MGNWNYNPSKNPHLKLVGAYRAFIFGNLFLDNFSYLTRSWYPKQHFLIGCSVISNNFLK